MPSPEIVALDAASRQAQANNAAAVSLLVLAAWRAQVDPTDIAGSTAAWLDRAIALITAGHDRSARLERATATAVRAASIPTAPRLALPPSPVLDADVVRRSMAFVGPARAGQGRAKVDAAVKALGPSLQADVAARQVSEPALLRGYEARRAESFRLAGVSASRAAARHVANGGRDMNVRIVAADPRAKGYVRITDGDPCYFCALLASRGAVYESDSFDESDARFSGGIGARHKVHDGCGCTMRAVYTNSMDEWPEASLRYADTWAQVAGKGSPAQQREAFRRLYNSGIVSG